jgi:hypothetical protein
MLTMSRGGKVHDISGLEKYASYTGHDNHVYKDTVEEIMYLERQMQFKIYTILMPFYPKT